MSDNAPIPCFWDGQVFQPESQYWARRADKQFAKGELLRLVHQSQSSTATRNHYFACVDSAWENLPPLLAERWPSPKHLRSYALIRGGFCYSDNIICPSHADAMRVAAFARSGDEYCLVEVKKNVVTRYRAKSQSRQAMGKEDFAASKEAVLNIISEIIGVAKQELSAAGQAA